MDLKKIEELTKEWLVAIGANVNREGLEETPNRHAAACEHLFSGYTKEPKDVFKVFDAEKFDEMIVIRDIEFYSTCEHHLIPFFGKVHVGYIPNGKILGASKIPRLIDIFARRLQNQERITSQVANALNEMINPKGVGVIIEAKHLCMMARGVEKQNATFTTSALTGLFKKNSNTRMEFMRLIGK
jgi:GTP cyclohydrolase IA